MGGPLVRRVYRKNLSKRGGGKARARARKSTLVGGLPKKGKDIHYRYFLLKDVKRGIAVARPSIYRGVKNCGVEGDQRWGERDDLGKGHSLGRDESSAPHAVSASRLGRLIEEEHSQYDRTGGSQIGGPASIGGLEKKGHTGRDPSVAGCGKSGANQH